MMMKIYKYKLDFKRRNQFIRVVNLVSVLDVIEQSNILVLYCLVGDEATHKTESNLEIVIYGTGHAIRQIPSGFVFLRTVSTFNGSLIWHVWYRD